MGDLRLDAVYCVPKEWEEWNHLYKILWFAVEAGGPDVEYCEKAVTTYMNIPFYSDWSYNKDKKEKRKVLILPAEVWTSEKPLTADLMTGWWNPLKSFMGLPKSTRREDLWSEVKDSELAQIKDEEAAKWLAKEITNKGGRPLQMASYASDKDLMEVRLAACKSCIHFLKVVYTPGNVIPAAYNPGGGGLDGWDTKLARIARVSEISKESPAGCKRSLKLWGPYLWNVFGNINESWESVWKTFIEENYLTMYFDKKDEGYKTVLSLWGENSPKTFKSASDEQWKTYFDNAYDKIIARNIEIEAKKRKY